MNEDYLKEIKENNDNFTSENNPAIEANYTINEQNFSDENEIQKTKDFSEPMTSTKKPKSLKGLFIVLGIILLIIAVVIGFSLLKKTDVNLANQEINDTTDLTDIENKNIDNSTDLENTENLKTETENNSEQNELDEILLNCQPQIYNKQVESFMPMPATLIKTDYEYNIIGFNDSNECKMEITILDMEYIFDENEIIEYLDNPENKLSVFMHSKLLSFSDETALDLSNMSEDDLEELIDAEVIKQKEAVVKYYSELTEEQKNQFETFKEYMTQATLETTKPQECFFSDLSYIPKMLGLSDKTFQESIKEFDTEISMTGSISMNENSFRADYDWGYCISTQ